MNTSSLFATVKRFLAKHKTAIAGVSSAIAIVLSTYNFVSEKLWDIHDVRVFIHGDVQMYLQELPIQVILQNRGKRNEVILSVTQALEADDGKKKTTYGIQRMPAPISIDIAEIKTVTLDGTEQAFVSLLPPQDRPWSSDQKSMSYGILVTYVGPSEEVSSKFLRIGTVTFGGPDVGASGANFESSEFGNKMIRLF
jgi:hypothetical protein